MSFFLDSFCGYSSQCGFGSGPKGIPWRTCPFFLRAQFFLSCRPFRAGPEKGPNGSGTGPEPCRLNSFNVYFSKCWFESVSSKTSGARSLSFIPAQFFLSCGPFRAGPERVRTGPERVRNLVDSTVLMCTSVNVASKPMSNISSQVFHV